MSISGNRAARPTSYGPGTSSGDSWRRPGTSRAQGPRPSRTVSAWTPATQRTPVRPGSPASSPYTRNEASAHAPASASGSIRYGHHSAPATAEVVAVTSSRDQTRTRSPRSARVTAVVRPTIPPPTTITSLSMPGPYRDRDISGTAQPRGRGRLKGMRGAYTTLELAPTTGADGVIPVSSTGLGEHPADLVVDGRPLLRLLDEVGEGHGVDTVSPLASDLPPVLRADHVERLLGRAPDPPTAAG